MMYGHRVSKCHPRVQACGAVDELMDRTVGRRPGPGLSHDQAEARRLAQADPEIAGRLEMHPSTVHRVLTRHGMPRLTSWPHGAT